MCTADVETMVQEKMGSASMGNGVGADVGDGAGADVGVGPGAGR